MIMMSDGLIYNTEYPERVKKHEFSHQKWKKKQQNAWKVGQMSIITRNLCVQAITFLV